MLAGNTHASGSTPFYLCENSWFYVFSLEGRFEDEELQQILDDIHTKRSFQY